MDERNVQQQKALQRYKETMKQAQKERGSQLDAVFFFKCLFESNLMERKEGSLKKKKSSEGACSQRKKPCG
jgi:hypothetical protein